MLTRAGAVDQEQERQTREAAPRVAVPPLRTDASGRSHDRVAKGPPIGELEPDSRGGRVPLRTLAIGGATLGVLISAALNAETATTTAESTRVTTASVQPDPIARDTPDWREMGRRKVSNGSSSAAAAPPIDVAGIDDPGVRAVATTVLDIVARDIQRRLIPPPSGLKLEAKSRGENAEHLAYWNRDRKAIGLCSELIQDRRQAEASYRERKAERYFYGRENRASSDRFASYDAGQSLLFMAYHELGHGGPWLAQEPGWGHCVCSIERALDALCSEKIK